MNDQDMFTEYPILLQEDFRKDIDRLLKANNDITIALLNHIRIHNDYEKLTQEKTWVPLAECTRTSMDELIDLFRPVRYIAFVALKKQVAPDSILKYMSEKGIIENTSPSALQRAADLVAALVPALEAADETTPPALPGFRIEKISTKANLITEFENEFDISMDEPGSYAPRVLRLHAYTTLELAFRDNEHESLSIALSEHHLKQLIRWLQLAEVQQQTIKKKFLAPKNNMEETQ